MSHRHYNTLFMQQDTSKQINELRTEIEELKNPHFTGIKHVMLRRKEAGNPVDYFEKTFAEYQQGFEANGEFIEKRIKNIFSRGELAWS